nr:MAG TPA: hypothetical protein [Caudoviricetes sp.]
MGRTRGQEKRRRCSPTEPGPFHRQARRVVLRIIHIPRERERNAR